MLLLHGLTATRRYVVMGSKVLERSGHRVIKYDARAHGHSSPAPDPDAYTYDLLARRRDRGARRPWRRAGGAGRRLDGRAHTAEPGPASSRTRRRGRRHNARLQRRRRRGGGSASSAGTALARACAPAASRVLSRHMGPPQASTPEFADTVLTVTRQRLSQHDHLDALADALSALPRSRPFGCAAGPRRDHRACRWSSPRTTTPIPSTRRRSGSRMPQALPNARLVTDAPGKSPVAWQGSQLSQIIADVVTGQAC